MTRYGGKTIRHDAGGRVTRVSFAGVWQTDDGPLEYCPHTEHKTIEAAARCARNTCWKAAVSPVALHREEANPFD